MEVAGRIAAPLKIWSEILGIHIEDAKVFWAKVFKACFKSVVDNQIV